jgi:hypothetical protein
MNAVVQMGQQNNSNEKSLQIFRFEGFLTGGAEGTTFEPFYGRFEWTQIIY